MSSEQLLILFDGYCNLCSGVVDFLLKHTRKNQFIFIPLQSETGKEMIQKYKLSENFDSVILIAGGKVFSESDAALKIVCSMQFPWKIMFVFRIIPRPVRNKIYRIIASNRYRWWGRRRDCRVL
jgi:predicted DCC family thiol-disulfide oxidoreductase YuxK